jgi:hypothetical protein
VSIHEPSDGIAEEVERHIQLALGVALLAAQKAAEARRRGLTEAEARSQSQGQQMRAQLNRERELARARVEAVHDDQWWQQAQPEEVATMSRTVEEWRDPALGVDTGDFDAAHERMAQEVNDRWSLDLSQVATLARIDDAAAANDQLAATKAAVEQAGIAASTNTAGETSTSAVRREQMRDRLAEAAVPDDAVEARMLADMAQARPVAAAVSRDQAAEQQPNRSHQRSVGRERLRAR